MLTDSEKSTILLGEHMLAMATIMNYKLRFLKHCHQCVKISMSTTHLHTHTYTLKHRASFAKIFVIVKEF